MRSFISLCALGFLAGTSMAGPFGLFGRRNYGAGQQPPAQQVQGQAYADNELFSCQGVANRMARMCRMMHCGNPAGGFEGVGMASTPEAALANTCKPHNGPPRDWGVARGADGRYYACRRW
jgi:hypothetical protein